MFQLNRLFLLTCLSLVLPSGLLHAEHYLYHRPVPQSPCELKGICSFKDATTMNSDYVTSRVTLTDETGHIFIVAYVGPGVIFKRQDGTEIKSTPGSAEEQCLVTVLKTSYAAAFNPPLMEQPKDAAGRKKFWTQYTVNRLIGIFQRRCATGKDLPER